MEIIPITTLAAAVLAVIMFALALLVSLERVAAGKAEGDITKYPYGDGNNTKLKWRIRAFGNFIEYTPFAIIMLGLLEVSGANVVLVKWLAISFVAGRILHALGMLTNPHFPLPRMIGMCATYAALLIPAFHLLF